MVKMGRPKKLKADRRTALVAVRLTPTEKKGLEVRAKAAGMTLAAWLRNAVLAAARAS